MKIMQIEPARAKAKDPESFWDDANWISEEKLDGWRFLMHLGAELERPHLTGRRTSSVTGQLSEKGLCVPTLFPTDWTAGYTVLDGEIMPPIDRGFRDIAGIMNVDPEDAATRIAEIGCPTYRVFDVLFHDGQDVREHALIERHAILRELFASTSLGICSHVLGLDHRKDTRVHYDEIVDGGGEGVVLKNLFGTYGESGAWIKVKRYSTLDVVITGWKPGKGKYVGQIGAAKVSVLGSGGTWLEVGQVSGMDDATRRDMTDNPGRWLGTVVEIAAQEWAKDRLRHPRFKRQRADADPRFCTFQKMQADLKATIAEDRQENLF